MIFCSNTFRMFKQDGLEDPADVDWLQANVLESRLQPGQKWNLMSCECGNRDDLV